MDKQEVIEWLESITTGRVLTINSEEARVILALLTAQPSDSLDAARYRWLRNEETNPALVIDEVYDTYEDLEGVKHNMYRYRFGEALDISIDKAIAALQPSGEGEGE